MTLSASPSIIAEGGRRVWSRQRIVWWILAVNLLLAAGPAMPLSHRIGDVTDHSLAARRLVDGFDLGAFAELISTPNVNFQRAFPESLPAIFLFLMFMLFMNGGILASYSNEYRLSTGEFFANCGAFFWRWVRMFLLFLIVLAPIALACNAAFRWAEKMVTDAAGEKTGYWLWLVLSLIALFLLMVVRLWFDMAQVQTLVEDEHSVGRSCARALTLTISNFATLFWLYFRISFLSWIGLALGLLLCVKLSGGTAVLALELALLWWTATRLWQRAAEMAWYQHRNPVSCAILPVPSEVIQIPPESLY